MPGKNFFAAGQFASQSNQCSTRLFSIKVRHHSHSVRQTFKHRHGGTALVVDQDEIDLVRVVVQRQSGQKGQEQLAFSRPGGSSDQTMRPLSALLEIRNQRSGTVPDSERNAQVRRAGLACEPAIAQIHTFHIRTSHQIHQPNLIRKLTCPGGLSQLQRGQST